MVCFTLLLLTSSRISYWLPFLKAFLPGTGPCMNTLLSSCSHVSGFLLQYRGGSRGGNLLPLPASWLLAASPPRPPRWPLLRGAVSCGSTFAACGLGPVRSFFSPSVVLFQGSMGRGSALHLGARPLTTRPLPSLVDSLQEEGPQHSKGRLAPLGGHRPASSPGVWWGPLETAPPLCSIECWRWVCWQWAQGLVPTSLAECWRLQVRALYYVAG